jgi:hypothetical protein
LLDQYESYLIRSRHDHLASISIQQMCRGKY